ncbi:dihydrofolate reductase [Aureibacter tunicatorum]|uniref:Dihydrofolate reductase n=1 Tax=Aureibacter tunicatorum TaxID=866807 RepID=A0AAE3XP77_9BACT|nr:dihydrofolate reductase [Aureibacter tunicatorum]MDR6241536.1 dihydrofolate reductase [Aureibacter tunicatorum]BDD07240.1 hypothetical protein AUTU_47230 [Aureibacter tunicatorum]
MIRLAFVIDKNNKVGSTSQVTAEEWPEPLVPEIEKMFFNQNAIVGSVTYAHNLEVFANLDPGDKELIVLTRNKNFDLHGNEKAILATDFMQVVEKYKDSDEVLVVGGGKVVWELFLPFADEMTVAIYDEELPWDIEFSSWKDAPMVEVRRDHYEGGVTVYYEKEKELAL